MCVLKKGIKWRDKFEPKGKRKGQRHSLLVDMILASTWELGLRTCKFLLVR